MTDKQQQALDPIVAELEQENRLMRARNERLERELNFTTAERDGFKDALERILAVSKLALWDGKPERVEEVGPSKRHQERND
jgi:hypothetical protein